MSRCRLLLVVAIRDPRKHILRSKAKLILVLIYAVTSDFSTPRLIDNNDTSLQLNTLHSPTIPPFTVNTKGVKRLSQLP